METKKIRELSACIEVAKTTLEFLKSVYKGEKFSSFAVSEAREEIPKAINSLNELKGEYRNLTGRRYYCRSQ